MTHLFRDAEGESLAPRGSVVAIGAFDGLHRGHEALLAAVRERAAALRCDAAALSFEPLPRQFFAGRDRIARLSTPREKIAGLARGVDRIGLLRFDRKLAGTSAEDFVRRVLVGRLNAREVWVGPEFRFGAGRKGDIGTLRALGAVHGYEAREVALVASCDERISATRIRAALAAGEFALAARLLGRPYAMSGRVIHGKALGRTLGFPTANLPIRWGAAPVHGIFAVRVRSLDDAAPGTPRERVDHGGVASLGTRPTVGGVEPLLEAHLFDYAGDLYGRLIEVTLVAKLRDELKFAALAPMIDQMHRDARDARAILETQRTMGPTS